MSITANILPPLPLTVITGFLGSGKTTLIRKLLMRPELGRTAVIINEYGEIGLDHDLIENSKEDLIELSTGCLCCVMRGDLTNAVTRLMDRRNEGSNFDRIILETTGLADPGPIVHALIADPVLRSFVNLDHVLVTVDSINGASTLEQFSEARKQIALADTLVITKTDIENSKPEDLQKQIEGINHQASIIFCKLGIIDPNVITNPQPETIDTKIFVDEEHAHSHGHADIKSVSLKFQSPIEAVALTLFLQTLSETFGADLIRLKGIICVKEAPETPAVVHGVQHIFHPMNWLNPVKDFPFASRLVLIGRGLHKEWLETLMQVVQEEVRETSR